MAKKFDMIKFLGEQAIEQNKSKNILMDTKVPDKHLQALDEAFLIATYRAKRTVSKWRESGRTDFRGDDTYWDADENGAYRRSGDNSLPGDR